MHFLLPTPTHGDVVDTPNIDGYPVRFRLIMQFLPNCDDYADPNEFIGQPGFLTQCASGKMPAEITSFVAAGKKGH
jgi:hypothetical protein